MAFIESRMPEDALLGATFGPKWNTSVTVYGSGTEQRNANWQYPLLTCNLPYANEIAVIETIRDYFNAAQGRAHGFRVKDPSDYKSCDVADTPAGTDQLLGAGDGSTTTFQLRKRYDFGTQTAYRLIKKPVTGTVLVHVMDTGSPSTGGDPGGWTVNTTTGVITFGTPPASGKEVFAGFEFDVPMRFDVDELAIRFIDPNVLSIQDLPLVELRL